MNNPIVNASNFIYRSTFYNQEFEDILKGIIACYYCIVSANTKLSNNENIIRDAMLSKNYLKSRAFKETHPPLGKYHFDKETSENNGRADIRILHVNPYKDDDAYYVIECKRLDGKEKLNCAYIAEGITRFTNDKKYPFYKNTAGMIGFIVDEMDIHQNVSAINILLNQHFTHIDTEKTLTYKEIVSDFEYSYFSRHKIESVLKIIYHLMFDFSENIIKNKSL